MSPILVTTTMDFESSNAASSTLSVSGFRPVFSLVMVFGNIHWNAGFGRFKKNAPVGQAGDVLEHVCVLDGLGG